MLFYIRLVSFIVISLWTTIAVAIAPAWKIVPRDSFIGFTATQNNAPVSGKFTSITGDINFDPNQLETSHIKIIVSIASVTTSYKDIENTLKSSDWLDDKHYPQAIFESSHFVKTGENLYKSLGTLTIRNQKIPATLDFKLLDYSATKARVQGTAILKRKQFNVGKGEWESTDVVKDEVMVQFTLSAVKE